MPDVTISTDRLTLRMAGVDDVPAILRYFTGNREFLEPWEPRKSEPFYTDEFWNEQVRRIHDQHEAGTALRLFIFPNDAPGEVIGTVNLTEIVRGAFHACYLGYGLSAAREGRGYMREALRGAIAHAFGPLRLHRIMANYLPHNRRSGNVLKALGFTVEGFARDYLRINGRWEDHVLTSLTNPAWTEE
ncbi:MAG TPA: ribosomal protein S5-alanine N-acetyltransferase [Longimicrobium sp.]|nr:ribosomal protein S5-alanine N-acetyltransferase [Longimicrobium sp.]